MTKQSLSDLSRRERQIMDIIYQKGEAAATEIEKLLPGNPSNSTVRTKLRVMEEKGYINKKEMNFRYVYYPAIPREQVKDKALQHLIKTFFNGSPERLVAAMLDNSDINLSKESLDYIALLIKQSREEEKKNEFTP